MTTDREEALAAAARGEDVVLVVAPNDPAFTPPDGPAGRIAVFVSAAAAGEGTVMAQAAAMEKELFGRRKR